jgi:hypothetical protein
MTIGRDKYRKFLIIIMIFIIAISLGNTIYAQNSEREDTPPLRERLFYGGSFGLQLGTITDIKVSPEIGLWLLPRVSVAIGPDYRYYKDRFDKTNIYGGKAYTQFIVIRDLNKFLSIGSSLGIFVHLEDELLSLKSSFWKILPQQNNRFVVNTVLVGGGLSQQLGKRSSLNLIVLWALNESDYDLYGNPEIRISFSF